MGNNITLNNLTIINCIGKDFDGSTFGGAVVTINSINIIINNNKFVNNYAQKGSAIYTVNSELTIINNSFINNNTIYWSSIYASQSKIKILNTTFSNITSQYATAIYSENGEILIEKSKFNNLHANITAGAIAFKKESIVKIDRCEFNNVSSTKNGGAIYVDIVSEQGNKGSITINNTLFKNCSSEFGGAYLQLEGKLNIINSQFIDNTADFNGGAIYLSYVNSSINNTVFNSNKVKIQDSYPTYGGAIFFDKGEITLKNSEFINNDAYLGSGLYVYDSEYNLDNITFNNNLNISIYTVYDANSSQIGNLYGDYVISQLNTQYTYVKTDAGVKLTIINNPEDTNITTIPERYDLRELGWVSNIRNQGNMGSCWAFGMTATFESALIKILNLTGENLTAIDFSENNMQNSMLKFSKYGVNACEGGVNTMAMAYLLSWFGAFPNAGDTYDELGKISPIITTPYDVHVQDIIIIPRDPNYADNNTNVKIAIMKYGSLAGYLLSKASADDGCPTGYYNETYYSEYVNESEISNHAISVVGWDDNFPKENFTIQPPGDGAWIIKNSWGSNWGDKGYMYVSYYDKTFSAFPDEVTECLVAIVLENTIPYNKNYQYDLAGLSKFISKNNSYVNYTNTFESIDDDMLAAVGTYFDKEGVNYTVQIKVNGNIVYTQKGVSPFYGYHTIKLNRYISLKKGDEFSITITSDAVPISYSPRLYYKNGVSTGYADTWKDLSAEGIVACIKAYTLPNTIQTENIKENYSDNKVFKIIVNESNATVIVSFNDENWSYVSDANGVVEVVLSKLEPGFYTITTKYNNVSVVNTIEVFKSIDVINNIVIGFNADVNVDATFTDKDGNALIYRIIDVDYDGKIIRIKTNEKGQIKIPLTDEIGNHILKLKNPVTGELSTTTVKIISRFSEHKNIDMYYYDGTYYKVRVYGDNGQPVTTKQLVTIKIDAKSYKVYTDSNGWAKIKIPNTATPGKHTISATYKGQTIKNTLNIKQVLTTTKTVSVKKSAKQLILKATLKNGKKPLKEKTITFKINGKTYKTKTDKNGIAKITIKKSVIKKLKIANYIIKITYEKNSIKGILKVKR